MRQFAAKLAGIWASSSSFATWRGGKRARLPAQIVYNVFDRVVARAVRDNPPAPIGNFRSVFVLRNNDLGDVLAATPLLAVLRKRLPECRISVGVGPWAASILENNPNVDEVIPLSAPWHNKSMPDRSVSAALRYVYRSPEIERIRAGRFDVGIDVLGSHFGALLLMRAGIPCRLGQGNYAGGEQAMSRTVPFEPDVPVGGSMLRFADLLADGEAISVRPQLFLSDEERAAGEARWGKRDGRPRVIVFPIAKAHPLAWPPERFGEVSAFLRRRLSAHILLGGSGAERSRVAAVAGLGDTIVAGELKLRESFAVIAVADLVVCNNSMPLHAAAAFGRPTVVLLGPAYGSATAEAKLWGYDEPCYFLGAENAPGRERGIAEVTEVCSLCDELLARR
jgi:ADP-heptose:LPS heptosyltransferase